MCFYSPIFSYPHLYIFINPFLLLRGFSQWFLLCVVSPQSMLALLVLFRRDLQMATLREPAGSRAMPVYQLLVCSLALALALSCSLFRFVSFSPLSLSVFRSLVFVRSCPHCLSSASLAERRHPDYLESTVQGISIYERASVCTHPDTHTHAQTCARVRARCNTAYTTSLLRPHLIPSLTHIHTLLSQASAPNIRANFCGPKP